MDAINSPAITPDYQPDRNDSLRTLQASRTDLAVVTRTEQTDIALVTAEGDKVTLSLDSRSAAMVATFEEVQTDGAGAMAYAKSELTMGLYQRDLSVTVEGDLNAEELRDINKALKTIDKMMNRFVNGKLRPMAAQARKLQELDTIATLDVRFSMESRTLAASQSEAAATYDRLGMPSAPRTAPPESGFPMPVAEADAVADAMVDEIQSAPTPSHRMMPFVKQLLDDYRRQTADLERFGRQMMDRIHSRLSSVLEAAATDASRIVN
jgi:hypothetical protein